MLNFRYHKNNIVDQFLSFLSKNIFSIYFFIAILFAFLLRIYFSCFHEAGIRFVSNDQIVFLLKWLGNLKRNGFSAFENRFSNYHAPYLYLLYLISLLPLKTILTKVIAIKIISIVFDFFNAWIISKIVGHYQKSKVIIYCSFIFSLFVPIFFLNSAVWGQCDGIYTFFCLCSIFYLFKKKYFYSFLFFAIGISFKMQAIFLLPFLLLYFLYQERKVQHKIINYFFIIPIVYLLFPLPIFLFTDASKYVFLTYFYQLEEGDYLKANMSNFYNLLFLNINIVSNFVVFSLFITGSVFVLIYKNLSKKQFNNKMFEIIIFLTLTVIFFTPKMTGRYYHLIHLLTFIYLFIDFKISRFIIFTIFQLASLFTYGLYLSNVQEKNNYEIIYYFFSLLILGVWIYLLYDIFSFNKLNKKIIASKNNFKK